MSVPTAAPVAAPPRPHTLWAAAPALLALSLTMLVEMIDNSVLNVALPTIGADLGLGATGLQWVVGAYSLTFGGLLLIGGTLGDVLGRRRVLLAGLVGFGASSLLVLLASEAWELIAVRALCGAFAALIAPGTMSLLFRLFDDAALRGRAIGLIVTVSMAGFALGPVLGGLAVEHLPWQALLLVNAPVAAIAWWGVRRGIAPDDAADLRPGSPDLPGAALSVVALASGLLTLTVAVEAGWTSPWTPLVALLSIGAGLAFVRRERRAGAPLVDLDLLARPAVRGSALLQAAVMTAMVGVLFASTQLFQLVWHWSPVRAGLGVLPLVLGMLLAGPLSDALTARAGHRRTAAAGVTATLVSLGLLAASMHAFAGYAPGLALLAAGMRLVMTTSAVALIEALPADHTSFGSALNDTAQELGNAVGVAVLGTVTAAIVGTGRLADGWSDAVADELVRSQRVGFAVLAGLVALIAAIGLRTLTDSTSTEEG
ncbi:MFS transporter [Nocardioides sp. TRM66260-LWL]|uniref:MFS transporter n=1 Tax=Nocardioides sp. TRM66260-LWL TaxID=2874478 RepID=UPI001CC70F49|nr:MFS transporter [Nocardioides sp. TRM66260-LWL]MBZ5734473.1 MFS transporter [Nocardioides sp. TRM66260-LWL]